MLSSFSIVHPLSHKSDGFFSYICIQFPPENEQNAFGANNWYSTNPGTQADDVQGFLETSNAQCLEDALNKSKDFLKKQKLKTPESHSIAPPA